MEQTQTSSKWKVWASLAIVAVAAAGIFFATRPTTPADAETGGPESWDAQTRQHVAEQHALAEEHFNQGRVREAQAVLEKLVTDYPADPVGHALLGKVHVAQSQWSDAYDAFDRSLALDGNQPETQFVAGTVAELLAKNEQAVAHYKRAAELDSKDARYPLRVANASMKVKAYDDVRFYALRALEIDDSISQAYALLAAVAAKRNEIDSAIDRYDKALQRTDPFAERNKFVSYTIWKARLLRRKVDPQGRAEALNVLLALPEAQAHTHAQVTEELAQTYLSLNRQAEAAGVWVAWFKDNPLDGRAAAQAGLCYHRAGQLDEARRWHDTATKLAPHLPETQALGKALGEKP